MELNRLTRDADELIRKVVTRYNQLYSPTGDIPQVELDLLLDDLRKLYESFKGISQLNLELRLKSHTGRQEVAVNQAIEKEFHPEPTKPAPVSDTEKSEPAPKSDIPSENPLPENKQTIADQDAEIFESKLKLHEQQEPKEDVTRKFPSTPVEKTGDIFKTIPAEDPTASTLAEKYGQPSKSLSDTIATTQESSIGSKLMQPVSDLASAIGLNDKFNFISNLFNNDAMQYEDAVNRINKAVNYDEALWILQKFRHAGWDENRETVARMTEFVRRRFI